MISGARFLFLERFTKSLSVSVQRPHLYSVCRAAGAGGKSSSIRLLGPAGSFSSVSLSQAVGSMPFSLTVAAGSSFSELKTFNVPAWFPAGNYSARLVMVDPATGERVTADIPFGKSAN